MAEIKERERKSSQEPVTPVKEENKIIIEDLDRRLNPQGITLKTWGRS